MKKTFMKWMKDALMGVGASLLAAGFLGVMTPGTPPAMLVVCFALGVMYMLSALLVAYLIDTAP